jgi:hypothetical protein
MTQPHEQQDPGRILVVGPDGQMALGTPPGALEEQGPGGQGEGTPLTELVEQPALIMRVGSMVKQLLEEVRSAPLDEASRARLREVHRSSIKELERGLAPELVDELERITLPFDDDSVPTDAELRIAQAQLVGWLEGLFHGIQTAMFAQQMAARAQFEEMRRRALPPGAVPGAPAPQEGAGGTGNYL